VTALRRLPPVHSPIAPSRTAAALLNGREARDARDRLSGLLGERFAADRVVLTDSGTHALQLALLLARMRTGRERVALPAYTCYDLVTAALGAGATPDFYDLDPDTLLPEPPSLRRALERSPAALVVVHHFGIPTPISPVTADAEAAGAWIIEDAAQAHGGRLDGRPLGSLADLGVLSFGRGKGWTGGGGGALLLRGEAADSAGELASRLAPPGGPASPALGLAAQWLLARPSLYALPAALPWLGLGETHYRAPSEPAGMPPRVAAVVLANAGKADAEIGIRRRNADRLRTASGDTALRSPPDRGEPGYLRLPLRLPGRPATAVCDGRARRLGILPSYPRPLPALDAVAAAGAARDALPGAATLARELFTAPTHSFLRPGDLERVAATLRSLR
jgi:perosamine synthetase